MVNSYHNWTRVWHHCTRGFKRLARKWGSDEQKAFDEAKEKLTAPYLLVHFDQDQEPLLACNVSPYGVGAVFSHRVDDGTDKPSRFHPIHLYQQREIMLSWTGKPSYYIWSKKFSQFSLWS